MHPPYWENNAAVKWVIAGSWLICVLRLIFMIPYARAYALFPLDLATCVLGVVASISIVGGLKKARMLVSLAALAFLANHLFKVFDWANRASQLPDLADTSYMSRLWSFYDLGYHMLTVEMREGGFAKGLVFFFELSAMPVVQLGIIFLIIFMRIDRSLDTEPLKRSS